MSDPLEYVRLAPSRRRRRRASNLIGIDLPPVTVTGRQELGEVLVAAAELFTPGRIAAVCVDRDRRLSDLVVVVGDETALPALVLTLRRAPRHIAAYAVATHRAELPAPDAELDTELAWEELHRAAEGGPPLLDWVVVAAGRYLWSVAEFAPTPAQW